MPLTRRLAVLPTSTRLAITPQCRPFTATRSTLSAPPEDGMPDSLAEKSFKGKTGGGDALSSTSKGAPGQPKISNLSVPGQNDEGREKMTDEQKREVEQHNKEFEKTHGEAGSGQKAKGG